MSNPDDIQVVVFRAGPQEFAFDILQVERILRYTPPAPLPKAPDFLDGVIPYEGGALPVIDFRKRLGLEAPIREETRLVVLALGDVRAALAVDAVREVARVDSRTIAAPGPVVSGLAAAYIAGIIARGDRTIIVLNARKLLTSSERLALAAAGPGTGTSPAAAASAP